MHRATRLRAVPSDVVPTEGDAGLRAVQRAWSALLPQAREIADEISAELLSHPGLELGAPSPEFAAEVRSATREHVHSGLRALAGLEADNHRAVDVWREFGRQQARRGVPLDAIANSYIRANRVLWDALVARRRDAGAAIDEHTLLLAGRTLWDCMDIQTGVLGAAYRQEVALLANRDDGTRARVLEALVEGRGADVEFAREANHVLGVAAGSPVTCVVGLMADGSSGPLRRPARALTRIGVTAHWHEHEGRLVGLVVHPHRTVEDVRDALRAQATDGLALMPSDGGVEGFATAFRLAARAAETLPDDTPSVECAIDRLPQILLAGNQEITHLLVEQVLGRLMAQPAQQRQVLLETLGAYVTAGLSPTRTAELLTCHRNTVIYRMRQVAELTDYDPHRPEDLLPLSLALLAVHALPYRSPASRSGAADLSSGAVAPLRAVRR